MEWMMCPAKCVDHIQEYNENGFYILCILILVQYDDSSEGVLFGVGHYTEYL